MARIDLQSTRVLSSITVYNYYPDAVRKVRPHDNREAEAEAETGRVLQSRYVS